MLDVQRAVRYVRANASRFGIAQDRIGVWGSSAGGHLAFTAATHFDSGNAKSSDPVERAGSRPDFAILAYGVVSLTNPYLSSRRNLLGDNPDPKLVEYLSNERHVTAQTPPTFMFHTNEDARVPAEHAISFYLALRKAGVPAELHIYEKGQHGAGLGQKDAMLATWPERLADWLAVHGLIKPKS